MKTVVVTGGSGAIGVEICKQFKSSGYNVALFYHSNEKKACEISREYGIKAYFVDLQDENSVISALNSVRNDFGKISCLINCAGICKRGCLQDFSSTDFDNIFAVNVKGAFLCGKHVLSDMLYYEKGDIINISSVWGQRPASCEVLYSASKGAIDSFTKSLADELSGSGIKVNALSLGFVDTPMNKGLSSDDIKEFLSNNGFDRVILPEEVGKACLKIVNGKASGKIVKLYGIDK